MDPAFGVAEKRPFEMNTEGPSASAIAICGVLYCVAECVERAQRGVDWSCDGRRTVTSDAVRRDQPFDGGEIGVGSLHHVVSGAAVNMNVDHPGREDCFAEVEYATMGRNGMV